MNCFYGSGRICTEPAFSILNNDVYVANFCLACANEYLFINEKYDDGRMQYNFFQCVAFGDVAKQIVKFFSKGVKISLQAIVENFPFKDSNGTPHFTHILLINQVEYDDDVSKSFKSGPKKSNMNKPMVSELSEISSLFKDSIENGFLCVNESDYYQLAMSNLVF